MKEKTIYALLMTMIPGLSLAADGEDRTGNSNNTPITMRTKELKEEARKQFPSTPQLKEEVKQKIRRDLWSDDKAERMIVYGTTVAKQKKDRLLREKWDEIEEQARQKRLERERKEKEKQVEELAIQLDRLAAESKREAEEKLKENEALASTISELQKTIETQMQEITVAKEKFTASEQFSDEFMEQMQEELQEKEAELTKTREQLDQLKNKEILLKLDLSLAQQKAEVYEKHIQGKSSSSSYSSPLTKANVNDSASSDSAPSKVAPNADVNHEGKEEIKSDDKVPDFTL
jgi:hypothetical protein